MQLKHYYIDVSQFVLTQCQILKSSSRLVAEPHPSYQEVNDSYSLTPNSYPIYNPINLTPLLFAEEIGDDLIDDFQLDPYDDQDCYSLEDSENMVEKQLGNTINNTFNLIFSNSSLQSTNHKKDIPLEIKKTDLNQILTNDSSLQSPIEQIVQPKITVNKWWEQPKYLKIMRYLRKKERRNWNNKFSYKCRKNVASIRLRIKGKFIGRNQAEKLLNSNLKQLSNDQIKQKLNNFFKVIPFT